MIAVTPAAARMIGYSVNDLVGKQAPSLATDTSSATRRWARVVKDGKRDGVTSLVHRDGRNIIVGYRVKAEPLGKEVIYVAEIAEIGAAGQTPSDRLTRGEAAEYARLSVSTIDRARRTKALRSTRTHGANGKVFIYRRDIDIWLSALIVALLLYHLLCCMHSHGHCSPFM